MIMIMIITFNDNREGCLAAIGSPQLKARTASYLGESHVWRGHLSYRLLLSVGSYVMVSGMLFISYL